MKYVCIVLIFTNDTCLTELPWRLSALIYVKPLEECLAHSNNINNISYYQPSSFLKCFIVRRATFHLSEPWDLKKWGAERNYLLKLLIKVGKGTLLPGLPLCPAPSPNFFLLFPLREWQAGQGNPICLEPKGAPTVILVNHRFKAGLFLQLASSFGSSIGLAHLQQWETDTIHILKQPTV